MIAAVLVAVLNCGASATQLDLDECAAQTLSQADAREFAAFHSAMRRFHNDAVLRLSEMRWLDARSAACAFAASMVAGGSMEPMIEAQCNAAAAQARVRDIALYTGAIGATRAAQAAVVEQDRVYGLLELLVTPGERELLADSQRTWIDYRDVACLRAKSNCTTALTQTRTQQLKDSWMAEPFWK